LREAWGGGQSGRRSRFSRGSGLLFLKTIFKTIKEKDMSIWTILFVVLLVAWIGGFTVFHVAGGLIHLLLVFAVISLILHFVMGRRTA
jgi:Family of unknown function (DUF5670)